MRILLLTYRGNPYCGGQGVYVSHLASELASQGHEVHCLEGPPYAGEYPTGPDEDKSAGNNRAGNNGAGNNGAGNNGAGNNGAGKNRPIWHRVPGMGAWNGNGNGAGSGGEHPLQALTPLRLFERAAGLGGQFPEMTSFSWRAFAKVRALLERYRFDVVHDNQSLGWGLLAIKALGLPTLATVHHPLTIDRARGFDPPASFRARLDKVRFFPVLMQGFVARRMSHIVTVSQASSAAISADFRIPESRIRVIYNGLDTGLFKPLPDFRKVPGRVVFVGNLEDPNKGGRYLLEAMASLTRPAHLMVATGGISRTEWLRERIARLGLRDRLTLLYRVPPRELVKLFASAEVAVSPSLFEGFGFPAAEAMACGLPLVAAEGGALPEVVGDAGVLVPPADSEALARAMASLLSHPGERERLGRLARERVRRKFRWDQAARLLTEVYREVIHAHR